MNQDNKFFTVHNVKCEDVSFDLISGEIYYDYSEAFRPWYGVEQIGEHELKFVNNTIIGRPQIQNKLNTPLLFLCAVHTISFKGNCDLLLYFLKDTRIIMTPMSTMTGKLARIRLWPNNEKLIHSENKK